MKLAHANNFTLHTRGVGTPPTTPSPCNATWHILILAGAWRCLLAGAGRCLLAGGSLLILLTVEVDRDVAWVLLSQVGGQGVLSSIYRGVCEGHENLLQRTAHISAGHGLHGSVASLHGHHSPGRSTNKKLPHERKRGYTNSSSLISLTCMVKNMHGQQPYPPDTQPLQLSRHMPHRGRVQTSVLPIDWQGFI